MRRSGPRVLLSVALATVATVAGCQWIGGFAGQEIEDEPATGGGGMGGSGGQGGEEPSCPLKKAPARPDDATTGDDERFIVAIRQVNLGEELDVALGLDLDDACTCDDEACDCASVTTCERPGVIDTDDEWERCDEAEGVDSNSQDLFSLVQAFEGFASSALLSFGILGGAGTVLFDVRQYNGEANDDDVFVGVYSTGAFQSAECNSGPPQWQGADAWPIDRESVTSSLPLCGGMPQPAVFDSQAYVTNDHVVANFDELTITFLAGMTVIGITLQEATVVMPLEGRPGGPWQTTGATIAGRWRVQDVFRTLAGIDPLTMIEVCSPATLQSTQTSVCAQADITVDAGPGEGCDAVSFGMSFNGLPALAGNTVDLPPSMACPELTSLDCETPAP